MGGGWGGGGGGALSPPQSVEQFNVFQIMDKLLFTHHQLEKGVMHKIDSKFLVTDTDAKMRTTRLARKS